MAPVGTGLEAWTAARAFSLELPLLSALVLLLLLFSALFLCTNCGSHSFQLQDSLGDERLSSQLVRVTKLEDVGPRTNPDLNGILKDEIALRPVQVEVSSQLSNGQDQLYVQPWRSHLGTVNQQVKPVIDTGSSSAPILTNSSNTNAEFTNQKKTLGVRTEEMIRSGLPPIPASQTTSGGSVAVPTIEITTPVTSPCMDTAFSGTDNWRTRPFLEKRSSTNTYETISELTDAAEGHQLPPLPQGTSPQFCLPSAPYFEEDFEHEDPEYHTVEELRESEELPSPADLSPDPGEAAALDRHEIQTRSGLVLEELPMGGAHLVSLYAKISRKNKSSVKVKDSPEEPANPPTEEAEAEEDLSPPLPEKRFDKSLGLQQMLSIYKSQPVQDK
ncbi:uncharacterized protein LOC136730429 [Amia ocellicauda]|uniref:uncharacterized protein LOC136730429 n=1 Tax=Amia ocellicauda TaxID=2972642 RepID=UPI003463934F